jgi:diguanylate cyclase (GGDEF)-like protein
VNNVLNDRRTADDQRLRALLVDDDPSYLAYVGFLLRRLGIRVEFATSGRGALDLLEQGTFDLLIIDYQMPGMNGLELISRIRSQRNGNTFYAIMLTARENVETRIEALSSGFDDILLKSMAEIELVAKIIASHRVILRQHHLDNAVRELYSKATRDELTGLFNRRFFIEEGERMLSRCRITMVLFDLDEFKQINDRWGHMVGDRVLRDVGSIFANGTRHDDFIARLGGDEFVMVAGNIALVEVERVAERIEADIRRLQWTVDLEQFSVDATWGIATSEYLPSGTLLELLTVCDHDLYKNKWLRKNPGAVYDYEHPPRESSLIDFPEPELVGAIRANEE